MHALLDAEARALANEAPSLTVVEHDVDHVRLVGAAADDARVQVEMDGEGSVLGFWAADLVEPIEIVEPDEGVARRDQRRRRR